MQSLKNYFCRGFSIACECVTTVSKKLKVPTVSSLHIEIRMKHRAKRSVVEGAEGNDIVLNVISLQSFQAWREWKTFGLCFLKSFVSQCSWRQSSDHKEQDMPGWEEEEVGSFSNSSPVGPRTLEDLSASGFRLTKGLIWNVALKPIFLMWLVGCQSVLRRCHKQ